MRVWAIVVAAGSGDRFGAPKQYELLAGRRVLDHALDACRTTCDGVVLVVPPDRAGDPEDVDAVVPGGATRADSVRAGLAAVPDDVDIVLVHDAARPRASTALFAAVIAAVEQGADGAVPGLPVIDTVQRVAAGRIVETLDRSTLVAVQTPQGFRAEILRKAHAGNPDVTDDATAVVAVGGRVDVVPGELGNTKITHRDDL